MMAILASILGCRKRVALASAVFVFLKALSSSLVKRKSAGFGFPAVVVYNAVIIHADRRMKRLKKLTMLRKCRNSSSDWVLGIWQRPRPSLSGEQSLISILCA